MSSESLKGSLLISGGGLFDPNFRHTVVLVGAHNAEGALGVVLNRPSELAVEAVFPPLAPLVADGTLLYQGGPVQPDRPVLLAELASGEHADLLVFGRVGFLVGEVPADAVTRIHRARVFSGYAGWGPGQLEAELEGGSWIVEPALAEDVFTEDPDGLWSEVLRRKGGRYRHLASMPFDPTTN